MTSSGPVDAIGAFIAGFNARDRVLLGLAVADDVTIIEPVPPFMWTGAQGLEAWLDDLEGAIRAMRMSNARLVMGDVLRLLEAGDRAFVSLNTDFCFEQDGRARTQAGMLTASLAKDGGAWRIAGFSFGGGAPV